MGYQRKNITYQTLDDVGPSNQRKAAVESYAEQVAKFFDFGIGEDLKQLVDAIGGRIHIDELPDEDESGSIFIHDEFDFDIVLPDYTSPLRDRFTISHELGHYFLHSKQGEVSLVAYRRGSGRCEWEANWFAAALLMPRKRFKREYKRNADTVHLASVFQVSRDAAEVRKQLFE